MTTKPVVNLINATGTPDNTTFLRGDGSWAAAGGGSGDVVGPSSSVDNTLVRFDGTTGKLIQGYTSGGPTVSDTGSSAFAADMVVTSAAASAFAVGRVGATNPAFSVDASAGTSATGVKVTAAAAAGGVTLGAISSGSDEALTISPKGSGDLTLLGGGGSYRFSPNGTSRYTLTDTLHNIGVSSSASAATVRWGFAGAVNSSLSGGTEFNQVYWNLGQTNTHASNTAITLQRDYRITGMTHAYASSGGVITDCAALAIDGPDSGGTNTTITNSHALYIPTKSMSNVTTANSIRVAAPTSATNNYAINATGSTLLSIGGSTSQAQPLVGANVNTTAVGNIGGGTDDLITYSLPASSLNSNGRGVRITAWGTTANNANAKTVTLNFGSTAILTNALTISIAGFWKIEALVFRTASNAQDYSSHLTTTGTAGVAVVDIEGGTSTQTDSSGITIKCTGAATADNDIVQEGLFVEMIN